jgi:hypothetical protein
MKMSEKEVKAMAQYIADYLAEENVAELSHFIVMDAIDAYLGGAAEQEGVSL